MSISTSETFWQRLRSSCHYLLGASLFKSGLAGLHPLIHEKTMRQLQRAAEHQHPQALLLFGQLLRYKGATQFNKIAGAGYLRQAAMQGNRDAQFLLAEVLADSDLVMAKELDESPVDWYLKAAQKGHIMSALRLSKIYHNGLYGESIDENQAQYWRDKFMSTSGIGS